jgi:hypothetical protein
MQTAAKPFIPSSWLLLKMIDRAEAQFDADREQALLREEARKAARLAQALTNEAKAKAYARITRATV